VCSGNSCRSPMAEYLLRDVLEHRGLADRYEVSSVGTLGIEGAPATDETIAVLQERGIDASRHQSTGLTREIIEQARLVIGMTTAHAAAAEHVAPASARRCRVLTEFVPGDPSRGVDDPIGQPISVYRRCAREIEAALPGIVAFLEDTGEGDKE